MLCVHRHSLDSISVEASEVKLKSKSSSVSRKRPIYVSDAEVTDCVSRFIYISF